LRKVTFRYRAGVSTALAITILIIVASLAGATLTLNSGLLASKDVLISARVVNSTAPSGPKIPPIINKNDTLNVEPDQQSPIVDVDNSTRQLANFTLIVEDQEGYGSNTPETGNHIYIQGTSVQVRATPDPNWVFNHWLLDNSREYSNPVTIVMNTTHFLKPGFTEE
jgi:hypothetical protein